MSSSSKWCLLVVLFAVVSGLRATVAVADDSPAASSAAAAADLNRLSNEETKAGFRLLFDGKTLDGWKAAENPGSFQVKDGKIVAFGPRAHLFYMGDIANHNFTDFDFRARVRFGEKSNSGIYFHAAYQESGWPLKQGYEAQIASNGHGESRKTGSLYKIQDMKQSPVEDGQWFDYRILVRGSRIVLEIDGKVTADYTEPETKKRLRGGTFALQCHDPISSAEFHTIRVRLLDAEAKPVTP